MTAPIADPTDLHRGTLRVKGLGALVLLWSPIGVRRLRFPGSAEIPGEGAVKVGRVPPALASPFREYFQGIAVDLGERVPLDLRGGTEFQRKVWDALRTIPRGAVRSYASVANLVGSPRAMRAVGMANRANPVPIVIPCHRVIQQGHRLGGYSGGLDTKRFLLALEGVELDGDQVMPGQLVLPV